MTLRGIKINACKIENSKKFEISVFGNIAAICIRIQSTDVEYDLNISLLFLNIKCRFSWNDRCRMPIFMFYDIKFYMEQPNFRNSNAIINVFHLNRGRV